MAGITEERFEEIVTNLTEYVPLADREVLRDTKADDLTRYHHGFGTAVRNHFKLWENPWEPELRDGVDYSPNHPDQISMRIIREMWKRLQK